MSWASWTAGIVLHVGVAIAVGAIPKSVAHQATAITVANEKKKDKSKKEEDKKDEPKKDPPKKDIVAPAAPKRAAAPAPPPPPAQNTPPPPPPAAASPLPPSPVLDALPNLGLSLGNAGGPGGIAVPQGQAAPAQNDSAKPRPGDSVKGAAPPPRPSDDCTEAEVKPKPVVVQQGAYTEQARTANVEGKVRLRVRLDAAGNVVEVSVIQGLGYGLDESAVAAAKRMKFSPATRCGKPAPGTTSFAMRFSLGE